jgi:hypothetical protein
VPQWLFYYGAAVVLVVSFVGLAVLWTKARLEDAGGGRPLPGWLQRIVLARPLRLVVGAVSFALLLLIALAALLGDRSPADNIAPTFVYVLFWLGLVPVVVLFGNVWLALNPWLAAADAVAWAWARAGRNWEARAYPEEEWGRWPAAFLLLAFTALELAYTDAGNPRTLGLAILAYSVITWAGMLAVGRRAWLRNGEAFTVYFGLLARLSPFARTEREGRREVVVRPPLTGMKIPDWRPGTIAFVAMMLGSVAFDGFSRTTWWQDRRYSLTSPLVADSPQLADLVGTVLNLAGLVALVLAVAGTFLLAVRGTDAFVGSDYDLPAAFAASLVPIALAYAVAHYFSLFVLQAQYIVPLASDPFGFGWNLFGTANDQPDLGLLSPNVVWYTQVAALLVGHVTGLVLAHDRAVALFQPARAAAMAQYPLLLLMVVYTVSGLWLLSAG